MSGIVMGVMAIWMMDNTGVFEPSSRIEKVLNLYKYLWILLTVGLVLQITTALTHLLDSFPVETSRLTLSSIAIVCFLAAAAFWTKNIVSFIMNHGTSGITIVLGVGGTVVGLSLGAYTELTPEEVFLVLLPFASSLVQLVIMLSSRKISVVASVGCDQCSHRHALDVTSISTSDERYPWEQEIDVEGYSAREKLPSVEFGPTEGHSDPFWLQHSLQDNSWIDRVQG